MLSVDEGVSKVLSETLKIIASHDFPNAWPDVLPNLTKRLQTDNFHVILLVLKSLSAIFRSYRIKMPSEELIAEMIFVMDTFAAPMLELFTFLSSQVDANLENEPVLTLLLKAIKVLFDIFYSLNCVDLPAFFQDNIEAWFTEHKKFLNFESNLPSMQPETDDPQPTIVIKIQAAVLKNISLYSSKYEDFFEPFLPHFLQDTWNLLMKVSQFDNMPGYDLFVNTAIDFLSTVARSVFHSLIGDNNTLRTICENVAFKNIKFTQYDEDMFETDPLGYIRSDMEGANVGTRRHSATELIKSLRENYESQVTQIFSEVLNSLLTEYNSDRANKWLLKDQLIYLVIALAIVRKSIYQAATKINELVPVLQFFETDILTELSTDIDFLPVIKADSLKFVLSFRMQLSSEHYAALFPLISSLLLSKSPVVVSYAAIAIDKLLLVKDKGVPRLPTEVLNQLLPTLFTNLFSAINKPDGSRFENENEFVMKAILRLISTAKENILPVAPECMNQLTTKLAAIYKNPTYPQFLHYLFESLSAIIRILVDNNDIKTCEAAEQHLLPAFNTILDEDIMELAPYVFQIEAQLIEARKNTPEILIERYGNQFKQFTSPLLWERHGNIPALTRLLEAFISFAPGFIIQDQRLSAILGVFQRLIGMKSYDKCGFQLIRSITLHLPRTAWEPFFIDVFKLFLGRLQQSKTVSFVTSLIVFSSLIIYRETPAFIVEKIESIEVGLFEKLLTRIFIPNMSKLSYGTERKTSSIGFTSFLCSDLMLQNYPTHWVSLLSGIIEILVGLEDDSIPEDFVSNDTNMDESGGFTSVFQLLAYSIASEDDPIEEGNPEAFFVNNLVNLSSLHPGKLTEMFTQLPQKHQTDLADMLKKYGATIA